MNKTQSYNNIARKKYKERISELEIEVSLLRQKLEMVAGIVGGVKRVEVPLLENIGKEGRAIATVWRVGDDLFFQSTSKEDENFLKSSIEKKKGESLTMEEQKTEQEKGEVDKDSFVEHIKR